MQDEQPQLNEKDWIIDPPGMTGWIEEADCGEPLVVGPTGELRLKIVATERGLFLFALSSDTGKARELLERIGVEPSHVRRLLCG